MTPLTEAESSRIGLFGLASSLRRDARRGTIRHYVGLYGALSFLFGCFVLAWSTLAPVRSGSSDFARTEAAHGRVYSQVWGSAMAALGAASLVIAGLIPGKRRDVKQLLPTIRFYLAVMLVTLAAMVLFPFSRWLPRRNKLRDASGAPGKDS